MKRLGALLDGTQRFIRRFVVLSDHQAAAVTLWIAHTHAIKAADVTPYLAITSPEKRAGKTKLLEVVELLVPRPLRTANISPAALFRSIVDAERGRATLLYDEGDRTLGVEGHEDLIGLFNAGYRRGAFVVRCEGEGKNIRVARYDAFGAKAIAAVRRLPDTIADRSIPIQMQRRARHEPLERFRQRDAEMEATPLRLALEEFFGNGDIIERLRAARPEIPGALDDRAADGWEPILALADHADGHWPRLAREAAVALHTGRSRDDDGLGVQLLADLYRLFTDRDAERLTTPILLESLVEDEGAPWGDLKGRRLTAQGLGRLLRSFAIYPTQWRDGSVGGVRGYERASFEDAWAHWLPQTAPQPLQPLQPAPGAEFSAFSQPQQTSLVADAKNGENPLQMRGVAVVADTTPGGEGKAGRGGLPADRLEVQFTVFTKAGRKGFPRCPYKPGHAVMAGQAAWRKFCATASREDLELAYVALEGVA